MALHVPLIGSLGAGKSSRELKSINEAINKVQAVIEFQVDGTILNANENFLNAMGYTLAEIQGQHHSMFVTEEYKQSSDYSDFWRDLKLGEFKSGEFQRLGKGGKEVWIQASYNPILDTMGQPYKVIKFASDITAQKQKSADFEGQMNAIHKSLAVIEFDTHGNILTANDNFLATVGYSLGEIQGQHHRMFVDDATQQSQEYREFWNRLGQGEFCSDEYRRIGKGGKEIWIQASYNPIFDQNGHPIKVVKYASDITHTKRQTLDFNGQMAAINRSQAVIEFELDGTIIKANDNFLATTGYTLNEIQGKHHSMFVEPDYKNSSEYAAFWQKLRDGHFESGEYRRLGKSGQEIWIQASYNPIVDASGQAVKVVKYASDITAEKQKAADLSGQIDAIGKSQAVIEFNMDGTIIQANDNFLGAVGYRLDEIQGKHHRIFVDNEYAASDEYQRFWNQLNQGEFSAGEYRRVTKSGGDLWIQATYNPILDANGRPFKVVKFATDITARKRAVEQISASLVQLSDGDLNCTINHTLEGEFECVREALNNTLSRLTSMVKDIGHSSGLVRSSSNEINSGTLDLSHRTESQASSLEETASSMEELTAMVNQNAQNAKTVNQVSREASVKADLGGETVDNAIGSMQSIEEASSKISDIIGVIDEIAFQTNLLALNAAVEAARAGEQGRGFAVVAGEVRNLAQRSAHAAKEIKGLIRDTVDKVSNGTALVNHSGEIFKEIVSSIRHISDLVDKIDNASQEQADGISQVGRAVTDMDTATQQNAALVEEVSAACKSMSDEAIRLEKLVQFFRA